MTNRWFVDTEFHEDGLRIELISIALVSEDGREYYAHSSEYDATACSDWVKLNVLPLLARMPRLPRRVIAADIRRLVGPDPEFWADFASYDWVALCQLYGTMMDLPQGWPMFCRDLRQLMESAGVRSVQLPQQHETAHNALHDARWLRQAFFSLQSSEP